MIELMFFKKSGKFYSDHRITESRNLEEAIRLVRTHLRNGTLLGVYHPREYHVLVTVHDVSYLILAENLLRKLEDLQKLTENDDPPIKTCVDLNVGLREVLEDLGRPVPEKTYVG